MKRTKNMVYRETIESEELFLYTKNDYFIYKEIITPVLDNLRKKVQRGVYDTEKAVDAFYYVATAAAKRYYEEFGNRFGTVIFIVSDRFTAATKLEENYREQILGLE